VLVQSRHLGIVLALKTGLPMAETIERIFVDPPIAIARLGGSTTPQNAYRWVESANPRSNAVFFRHGKNPVR
jgi:hypothetical protein